MCIYIYIQYIGIWELYGNFWEEKKNSTKVQMETNYICDVKYMYENLSGYNQEMNFELDRVCTRDCVE